MTTLWFRRELYYKYRSGDTRWYADKGRVDSPPVIYDVPARVRDRPIKTPVSRLIKHDPVGKVLVDPIVKGDFDRNDVNAIGGKRFFLFSPSSVIVSCNRFASGEPL